MLHCPTHPPRRAVLSLALLALAAACVDQPTSPEAPAPVPEASAAEQMEIEALACTVTVSTGKALCVSLEDGGPGNVIPSVVLDPEGKYVDFTISNIDYTGETYTFDATVTNLIQQTLGVTHEGLYDNNGIRVFFTQLPTVTEGTGTITVNGAETGTVTKPGQVFYRYPQTLAPGETSAPRQWNFTVPNTVVSFTFSVKVAAAVQYPHGWVEITTGEIVRVGRDATREVNAIVRDFRGKNITDTAEPVTWEVEDESVATTSGNTVIGGALSGFSTLIATSGNRTGQARLVVGHPFIQLSGGAAHTCALTERGRAYCWGANGSGQLGNGTTVDRLTPVDVEIQSGLVRLVQVAAGGNHTCAVDSTGQAWCWGAGTRGQLGNNSMVDSLSPVMVHQGALSFVEIAAGEAHTCAVTASMQAYCWGANDSGQLGDNTVTDRSTPTAVQQGAASLSGLSLGSEHSCTAGTPSMCWGNNIYGQLGDGFDTQQNVPVEVRHGPKGYDQIAAGGNFTCGRRSGLTQCWGANGSGQLGTNVPIYRYTPGNVLQGDTRFTGITAGYAHACGVTPAGQAWCWGNNAFGQVGDNTTTNRPAPVMVQQGSVTFMEVAAGDTHTCGLAPIGRAWCWGNNGNGQLGDNSTNQSSTPVAVQGAP